MNAVNGNSIPVRVATTDVPFAAIVGRADRNASQILGWFAIG